VIASYGVERRRTRYQKGILDANRRGGSQRGGDAYAFRWDETFTFVHEEGRLLQLEVWNRNRTGLGRSLSALDYLGTVLVNPGMLEVGKLFEQWLPLEGVGQGQVLVRVRRHAPPGDRLAPTTAAGVDHQLKHHEVELEMRSEWLRDVKRHLGTAQRHKNSVVSGRAPPPRRRPPPARARAPRPPAHAPPPPPPRRRSCGRRRRGRS